MMQEDTLKNYNQIKGRNMIGYFKNNNMDILDVFGNSEAIYFALEQDSFNIRLTGMNRILCSNMKFWFLNNDVHEISFYKSIDAKFIPPHELEGPEKRLAGFDWRIDEKPSKAEVLRQKSEEEISKESEEGEFYKIDEVDEDGKDESVDVLIKTEEGFEKPPEAEEEIIEEEENEAEIDKNDQGSEEGLDQELTERENDEQENINEVSNQVLNDTTYLNTVDIEISEETEDPK